MIMKRLHTGLGISTMQVVRHRVNTIEQLQDTPSHYGIEFDVREGPNGIVVTHDPWTSSVDFRTFLEHCHHAFYIVNVKCEGIEPAILEILRSFQIENFFLLDCSFPMIVKLGRLGERRVAVRLSEYESIETVFALANVVQWVWVDVFHRIPVTPEDCQRLRALGFRLCFVSPELQGRPQDIAEYKECIGHWMDMVCTKVPTAWQDASFPLDT
jgi:hypothetical protein